MTASADIDVISFTGSSRTGQAIMAIAAPTQTRAARAIRAGTVWINTHLGRFAEAETGSYGKAGSGRLHRPERRADFLETELIYLEPGTVPI